MDSADGEIGVWKSALGKGRKTPKGRQVDDAALADVQSVEVRLIVLSRRSPDVTSRRADTLVALFQSRNR